MWKGWISACTYESWLTLKVHWGQTVPLTQDKPGKFRSLCVFWLRAHWGTRIQPGACLPGPLELFYLVDIWIVLLLAAACATQISPVRNPVCSSDISQWDISTYSKTYSLSFWGRTTKGRLKVAQMTSLVVQRLSLCCPSTGAGVPYVSGNWRQQLSMHIFHNQDQCSQIRNNT